MDDSGISAGQAFPADEWELVKELVFEYQVQNPKDLNSWLDAQSPPERVRREVERLLRSASTCGDFLQQPAPNKYFGVSRKLPARIGRYRVIEEIGVGGMGVVYAAVDEELNRRVAIKVLLAQTAEDPELRKRLRWDAQAASALQHPNIVTVHEVGFDGGSEYVAMECIIGQTLGRLIPDGGMETTEVLRYAIQIASGLEAAHLAGVVHRDLKPSNIMITESGVVKLLDFGLAKGLGAGFKAGDAPPTIEGKFAGTVAYVSPEQAEGKTVDVRSDIFSFGSVLFEMLTGRRAFPGDHAISVLADILHTNPPATLQLHAQADPRLDEIVQRCLRKDRARRFQSIGEVKIRLQEIEEEVQYEKQDRSAVHPPVQIPIPPTRRHPMLTGALIGVAATAALATGVYIATRKPVPAETLVDRKIVLTRATSDAGLTEFPAISRDGKFLAYASDRDSDGNLNIWLQQLKSSGSQPRTSDPADDYEPEFSPDGNKLLFRSERNPPGLYIIPTVGGTERLLAANGRGGHFSPDGKFVAYWTGETGAVLRPKSASIYIVPTSGGGPQQFRPDFLAAASPVWVQGDRLLFLGRQNDDAASRDWWVASVDGKFTQQTHLLSTFSHLELRELPGSNWLVPAAILQGGSTVLFSASNGDATNVWGARLSKDGVSTAAPQRFTAGTTLEMHPSATDLNGNVNLAYATVADTTYVWRVFLNAHGEPSGKSDRLIYGYDSIASPSISWDGSRIIFASHVPEGQAIRMTELNAGKKNVPMDVKTRRIARPVLSGDGKTLAYLDSKGAYVLNIAAGTSEKICDSCGPPTHVSFDGRDVLFDSAKATDEILISSGRKPPRPLFRWEGAPILKQLGARFSPNLRWVVFYGSPMKGGSQSIWIAPVREEGPVRENELIRLTDDDATESEPYWSPDGQTIYFLSNKDSFNCVWGRHIDQVTARPQGPVFSVADFHRAQRSIRSPSPYFGDIGLSVAKDSLVFVVAERTSNIWMQADSPPRPDAGFARH